uniref:Uncharacterized protein n=1 Tax=Romanomermis culicivorax TaxID=13658 RepID=A0A915IR54_ROMCU
MSSPHDEVNPGQVVASTLIWVHHVLWWSSVTLSSTNGQRLDEDKEGESSETIGKPFVDSITISKGGRFTADIPVFIPSDDEKVTKISIHFNDDLGHCSEDETQYTQVAIKDQKDQELRVFTTWVDVAQIFCQCSQKMHSDAIFRDI